MKMKVTRIFLIMIQPKTLCTHVVLIFGDLLFQNVCSYFIVFYHTVDLQLFDAVSDRNQLRSSPQEPVHLYGAHTLFQLGHIGLIVPLIIERNMIYSKLELSRKKLYLTG